MVIRQMTSLRSIYGVAAIRIVLAILAMAVAVSLALLSRGNGFLAVSSTILAGLGLAGFALASEGFLFKIISGIAIVVSIAMFNYHVGTTVDLTKQYTNAFDVILSLQEFQSMGQLHGEPHESDTDLEAALRACDPSNATARGAAQLAKEGGEMVYLPGHVGEAYQLGKEMSRAASSAPENSCPSIMYKLAARHGIVRVLLNQKKLSGDKADGN